MAESDSAYAAVFTAEVADSLLGLSKSRQRRAVRLARQLASHAFVRSDYATPDSDGHRQEHLLMRKVRITDIEDAS